MTQERLLNVVTHSFDPLSLQRAWIQYAEQRMAIASRRGPTAEGRTTAAIWKAMTREERRDFKRIGRTPHDFRRTAVRNLVRAGGATRWRSWLPPRKTTVC